MANVFAIDARARAAFAIAPLQDFCVVFAIYFQVAFRGVFFFFVRCGCNIALRMEGDVMPQLSDFFAKHCVFCIRDVCSTSSSKSNSKQLLFQHAARLHPRLCACRVKTVCACIICLCNIISRRCLLTSPQSGGDCDDCNSNKLFLRTIYTTTTTTTTRHFANVYVVSMPTATVQ